MISKSTFVGWVTRMPIIKRWALMHVNREENICEHSHQVAVIAHLLTVIKNEMFGGNLSPDRAATVAVFHEFSELYGDCPTPIKYSSKSFTKAYKQLEHDAEEQCVASIPKHLQGTYRSLIVQAEVDEEYKKIVKMADVIAAYIKACEEVHHNNPDFVRAKTKLGEKVESIRQEAPEAEYFINTFLDSCIITLDELMEQSNMFNSGA